MQRRFIYFINPISCTKGKEALTTLIKEKTTAQQIPLLEDTFGPLKGFEFASSNTIGTFGHVENFVLKYEKNALRIYLIYYNSGNGWQVNSLLWDDRWDYLFDDTAKSK